MVGSCPDSRINKNQTAEKKPKWPNETAEFDETAESRLALFPTYYVIANKSTQYYTTC